MESDKTITKGIKGGESRPTYTFNGIREGNKNGTRRQKKWNQSPEIYKWN